MTSYKPALSQAIAFVQTEKFLKWLQAAEEALVSPGSFSVKFNYDRHGALRNVQIRNPESEIEVEQPLVR